MVSLKKNRKKEALFCLFFFKIFKYFNIVFHILSLNGGTANLKYFTLKKTIQFFSYFFNKKFYLNYFF